MCVLVVLREDPVDLFFSFFSFPFEMAMEFSFLVESLSVNREKKDKQN